MNNKFMMNEDEINKISICENNEPLVDLKEQNEISYGPTPGSHLAYDDYTKIRKTVYNKLCNAQKKLPIEWKFRIYEGLRSLKVQKILFDTHFNDLKAKNSTKSEQDLYREASLLISPTKFFDGTVNISPHSTGGAVDLEITDSKGELIDFGMTIKDWNKVEPEVCETYSQKVSDKVLGNRKILLDVMHEAGFVNYPREWWHFSYGDRLWAYLKGKKEAIYGGVF